MPHSQEARVTITNSNNNNNNDDNGGGGGGGGDDDMIERRRLGNLMQREFSGHYWFGTMNIFLPMVLLYSGHDVN